MTRAGRAGAPPPTNGRARAYFLDVDGTLVDFAADPARIRVRPGVRRLIGRLSAAAGGALALVTGRPIADVDRLFPGTRLPIAGQHGTERRDALGRIRRHLPPVTGLDRARARLAEAAARHPGLLLEDKGISLALHYRRAPRLAGYAHRLMRTLQPLAGAQYCVQAGKRVVELRPGGRHKGMAIREFMHEAPFRGREPVFIGDDATDEHGFAVANRLGGLSVKVGPGATSARCRLADVRAVEAWLSADVPAQARLSHTLRRRDP